MVQIFPNDDHDTIVRKFADMVRKNNPDLFRVVTNLPGDEAVEIAGTAPDILLLNPEDSAPRVAIEVETAATVSQSRAEQRWLPIAGAVPKFQVVLPKGTVNRAKRYCKRLGIKAAFHEI